MTRKYSPEVGMQVKLRLFEHYSQLQRESQSPEPHMWAGLKVLELLKGPESHVRLQLYNGPTPCEQEYTVPLSWISLPIGWKPVYTVYCKSLEQCGQVKSWFTRGIHVWASHDLSSAGGKAFTPFSAEGEATTSPHWQYTGNPCESVPADQCPMVFNIVHLEHWEVTLPRDKKERAREIAVLRAKPGVTMEYNKRTGCWFAERETIVYTAKPWEE